MLTVTDVFSHICSCPHNKYIWYGYACENKPLLKVLHVRHAWDHIASVIENRLWRCHAAPIDGGFWRMEVYQNEVDFEEVSDGGL